MLEQDLRTAANMVAESNWTIALTGAGISVDSGIPDFRSPGGLWERFNPMEYATIDAFLENPDKVWEMLKEMSGIVRDAKPNPGHLGLAELEQMGILKAVITQNIDNLHQDAGSQNVIEFHGNSRLLICMDCNIKVRAEDAERKAEEGGVFPPRCEKCDSILKPDVVFFGEQIPINAAIHSQEHARKSDLVLVVGTSATVYPAAGIPHLAKQTGAHIIVVDLSHTQLTSSIADVSLIGSSSEIMPKLVDEVRKQIET